MDTRHVVRRRGLPPVPGAGEPATAPSEAGQRFVAGLRATAADFAAAAGASSAVVPEAVPPARHRRARCRVVLRYADGHEDDVSFLGATGLPDAPSQQGFDRHIRLWLAAGQPRDHAWLVPDPGSPDGVAVDMVAWLGCRKVH